MEDADDRASTRARILYMGAKLTDGDRNKQYGEPVKNMQDIAALWETYLRGMHGFQDRLTGEDVAHMMSLMKIARAYVSGPPHVDNYVDGAVYQAIAGECAEAERP